MHVAIAYALLLGACVAGTGCQRLGGGSGAAADAHTAADLARRTGVQVQRLTCDDPALRAACLALLAEPIDEAAAVKIALLGNASVREAYERLGIARADLLQAGLIANPVFSASARFFSAGPEVELGLAQSFVEIFFVPLRKRVATAELCAAQADVVRTLVRLVYDARRALVALRGAQDVAAMRIAALESMTAARELMVQLHGAGNARDADLTIEEVGAARAQLSVDAALLAEQEARADLGVLLGRCAADVAWTVAGSVPSLADAAPLADADADGAVEARALAASLDLLENKARIHAALAGAGLARSMGGLPGLELGVEGERPDGGGSWGFGPAVSTTLPLFDTGAARVLGANALVRSRMAHHEQLGVEIVVGARRLAARVRALRAREIYLREKYVPLRKRLLEQTVATFHAMQIGAFDVLDAKEGEVDAQRELVETQTAAWLAVLDLSELQAGSLNRERLATGELPEAAERPTPLKGH